jgi:hypothetical protein
MSQPPNQTPSGQPWNQPGSGQPFGDHPTQPWGQSPEQPQWGQSPEQPQQPQWGAPQNPYQGQPNPDVPTSIPPGYPPTTAYPSSGAPSAPGYPAPDGPPAPSYPGLGAPGFPGAQPPKKKSKAMPIIMISLAIVLLLCVGGGVTIYLTGKNVLGKVGNNADAQSSTGPGGPASAQPSASKKAGAITVTEPKTLGGRKKITDPSLAAATAQLKSSLAESTDGAKSIGSIYGDVAEQDIVIVAATATEIPVPSVALDATFKTAGNSGLALTGITSAPAGSLGGSAKCGKGEASGAPLIMCGWADQGSIGWVIWYFESMDKAKAEFPKLRAQIEKKS